MDINRMNRDYWNNKEKRSMQAFQHTARMEKEFPGAIESCVKASKIYTETHQFSTEISMVRHQVPTIVLDSSSVGAAFTVGGNPTILNFASFKNPGGKFLNGSMAQEESLCHSSFLYNVLREFDTTYYRYNRQNVNRSMYLNRAIYTPNVAFFNGVALMKTCNVITCAAPNAGAGYKYYGVTTQENSEYLQSRCKFVLDIAKDNNIDILILGAFGCGVFQQNPREVATIFKTLLESGVYSFSQVIFAIPNKGHGKENYNAFFNIMH